MENFDVLVITEQPRRYLAQKPKANLEQEYLEDRSNIHVIRMPAFPFLRSVMLLRYFEQFLKMLIYFFVGLMHGYQRDIIVYSPPLTPYCFGDFDFKMF